VYALAVARQRLSGSRYRERIVECVLGLPRTSCFSHSFSHLALFGLKLVTATVGRVC
jgi:hypothetical protein